MSLNIFPDLTNSKFDIKYVPALAASFDIFKPKATATGRIIGIGGSVEVIDDTFNNVDGGFAASLYLPAQKIDGGGA